MKISLNGKDVLALIDSGSTDNFIHPRVVKMCSLKSTNCCKTIMMATKDLEAQINGFCVTTIIVNKQTYPRIKMHIFPNLCADVILGQNWQALPKSVTFKYGGSKPEVKVCNLMALNVSPPPLFSYLSPNVKPIASKSRKYSEEDKAFIKEETDRLLREGIIEHNNSPWRAQVVVTKNYRQKKRLVIDYSLTINKFTNLDAYPLPKIDEMTNQIAQYRVFSTIDLKSAYHQVPLREEDKKFTAFEANGCLYQFRRMPFGVTNGVATFQRIMNDFITSEGLLDTFAYLDNVTICGKNQAHHDYNLERFLKAAKSRNLTYNPQKCVFSTKTLNILGNVVSEGEIRPDPDRMKALYDLPPPRTKKELKRILGLFSYYSQWINNFSAKIRPLISNIDYPLNCEALDAFNLLKRDIANATLRSIDESLPFLVETDASDYAIAATLSQQGRPVAFFSRTLNRSELKHSTIEKEAAAIIEAVRK